MLAQVALGPPDSEELPSDVGRLIQRSSRRIHAALADLGQRACGFVPCDYEDLYRALVAIGEVYIDKSRFCEWGSGFGVGCVLASLTGSEACGIEIRSEYVRAARDLATELGLDIEFYEGSFVPSDYDPSAHLHCADGVTILSGSGANDEVDVAIDDFDLIYAFPWPGEEDLYFDIFDRYAACGAHLLTYHGPAEGFALQRKI